MNIRKPIDYKAMFAALDQLIASEHSQVSLYCAIGRLVGSRPEKGAAVAAAEYLQNAYPDMRGFSPRNVRRMRLFYSSYRDTPEIMIAAMAIGWTQNVVILESALTLDEKHWYIRAVLQFGWSKLTLVEKIRSKIHLELSLDLETKVCYTEKNNAESKHSSNDKDKVRYNPRQNAPYTRVHRPPGYTGWQLSERIKEHTIYVPSCPVLWRFQHLRL